MQLRAGFAEQPAGTLVYAFFKIRLCQIGKICYNICNTPFYFILEKVTVGLDLCIVHLMVEKK